MCYSALEHLLCVMSGSSKFTGIVGAKQMIVPLNKALSLKGLKEITLYKAKRTLSNVTDLRKSESNSWSHIEVYM